MRNVPYVSLAALVQSCLLTCSLVQVLHGRDRLMDVPAILRWLGHGQVKAKSNMPLMMVRGDIDHGGFLLDRQWMVSVASCS